QDENGYHEQHRHDYSVDQKLLEKWRFGKRRFARLELRRRILVQFFTPRPKGYEREQPMAWFDVGAVAAHVTASIDAAVLYVAREVVGDQRGFGPDPLELMIELHETDQEGRPAPDKNERKESQAPCTLLRLIHRIRTPALHENANNDAAQRLKGQG